MTRPIPVIMPFPLARRRNLVGALARQMATRSGDEAEEHLQRQLRRQVKVLRRKQLADDVIEAQVRGLDGAVRAELWRIVLVPPRPTGIV